ncbi:MAG: hypothetical protein ACRC7O_12420 [Fimbriiglobus sp.]
MSLLRRRPAAEVGAPVVLAAPNRGRAKRAVLWGVLGFVGLQLGAGLAAELFPRIRDPLYGDKAAKLRKRLAVQGAPADAVVMIGSSRTGFAFHGTRVEAALAERGTPAVAFNFGIPASGPVTHLIYLNRLLKSGVAPKLLLVEVLPSMLADDPAGPTERMWFFADRVTASEVNTLVSHGFAAGPTRERYAKSVLLPAYTLRFQLLSRVAQSWLPWQVRFDWSRGSDVCGWGTPVAPNVTPEQRAVGIAQAKLEYEATLGGLRPGGGAVAALRDVLSTCRDRGIPVRLVLMPEGSAFRPWYGPGVNDRLTALLNGLATEYGAPLIDARDWLPDDAFHDAHHMLRGGAEAFSDRLAADVIAPALRVTPR